MVDVVPKPVRKRNLVAALDAALQRAGGEGPGSAKTPSTPPVADAAAAAVPAFDATVYQDLAREIGPETMAEAFAMFARETEGRLQRMRTLDPAQPGELDLIGREAHTLKGDAGSFGLLQAAAAALILEKAARGTDVTDYARMLAGLEQAVAQGMAQVPPVAAAA